MNVFVLSRLPLANKGDLGNINDIIVRHLHAAELVLHLSEESMLVIIT